MPKRVLVVDDDPAQRRILEETIKRFGYNVATAESGDKALAALKADASNDICLVLLDLVMPGTDGMAVLGAMRTLPKKPPAIVQTAHGSDRRRDLGNAGRRRRLRGEAGQSGAARSLHQERAQDRGARRRAQPHQGPARGELGFADLITGSEAMTRVIELGKRAAKSTIPVLIEGESGVGKELIARAIQGESARAGKPFVTVNCGAIPENLVESILFATRRAPLPAPRRSMPANSSRPIRARCFSTRSASCRSTPRSSCFALCKTARSIRSARSSRSRSISA